MPVRSINQRGQGGRAARPPGQGRAASILAVWRRSSFSLQKNQKNQAGEGRLQDLMDCLPDEAAILLSRTLW